MTLKELSKLFVEEKHKNIPAHCRPTKTFTDKTANGLTNAILAFFTLKGIKAWRQASEGRYIKEQSVINAIGQKVVTAKGKFIPRGKASKGIGDVVAVVNGLFTCWEVKIGKDRQSEDQKKFEKEITASGGKYFLVKTWDDFFVQVKEFVK